MFSGSFTGWADQQASFHHTVTGSLCKRLPATERLVINFDPDALSSAIKMIGRQGGGHPRFFAPQTPTKRQPNANQTPAILPTKCQASWLA
jgi:hypothetical protein